MGARRVVMGFFVVLFIVALASFWCASGRSNSEDAAVSVSELRATFDDPPSLGDGAYVGWLADGTDTMRVDGGSDLATVVVHGRDQQDIVVRLFVEARIGALTRTIWQGEVEVAQAQDVPIPLDIGMVEGMHEKQLSYPTRLRGNAVVVDDDRAARKSQSLPHRYVVLREGRALHQVYDRASFAADYPRGVTDPAELARVEALIDARNDPEDASEEILVSGVHVFVPDNAAH